MTLLELAILEKSKARVRNEISEEWKMGPILFGLYTVMMQNVNFPWVNKLILVWQHPQTQ